MIHAYRHITDRYKRYLLLLAGITLPWLLHAQSTDTAAELLRDYMQHAVDSTVTAEQKKAKDYHEQQTIRTHYLWDRQRPINIDSTGEWWSKDGLVERKIPVKIFNQLKADKDLQYHKRVEEAGEEPWIIQALIGFLNFLDNIRVFLFILLSGGLVLLIVFFMRQQGFRFFRKEWDDALPGAPDAAGHTGSYEREIEEAIAGGRLRLAVRFLHLQALYILAQRQLIALSKDKTNADYLRGLQQTPWHQAFAGLTRDYEYIWYGETQVDKTQFDQIHSRFRQFIQSVDRQ